MDRRIGNISRENQMINTSSSLLVSFLVNFLFKLDSKTIFLVSGNNSLIQRKANKRLDLV